MGILSFLLIWFHHMDTILVVLLVFLNLTLYLNLPYCMRTILLITFYMIYIYFIDISECKQVNIVLLCVNIHMYHISSNFKGLLHSLCIQSLLL